MNKLMLNMHGTGSRYIIFHLSELTLFVADHTQHTQGSASVTIQTPPADTLEGSMSPFFVGRSPPTHLADDSQNAINISLGVAIPLIIVFILLGVVVRVVKRRRQCRSPTASRDEEMDMLPKSGQVRGSHKI